MISRSASPLTRAILWSASAVTVLLLVRLFVCETARVLVDVQPPSIFADGRSAATVRVVEVNRLGVLVPFSSPRLRCTLDEGTNLVDLAYNADSTEVLLRARWTPGIVSLRIVTDAALFPMAATLRVEALLAERAGNQKLQRR